jgi:tungstate transport system substrate-binding protein
MRSIRLAVAVGVAVVALAALLAATASAEVIRVQSTTDVHDSGQWENVFEKPYLKLHPGDSFVTEFVGTGKALENAKAGKADVVITHAPSLEEEFVTEGYSQEALGRAIFYNDYVIVGPKSDPAGIEANDKKNAVGAFERIAKFGAEGKATFVSRNDNSGTNVQEQDLWGLSAVTPKRTACNAPTSLERKEPGSGACEEGGKPHGVPVWYLRTGLGQAANLAKASECAVAEAPNGGCYTMLDRGTWIANEGKFTNLKIVSAGNEEGIVGTNAALQTNYFHAYILSTAKAPYPNGTTPNVVAAKRFVEFLTSVETQKKIGEYPEIANPAGHRDTVAEASYLSTPSHGAAGSTVSITATLKYAAPPKLGLAHYPSVQLQRFEGGWTNVPSATGETNTFGEVTFSGVKLGSETTEFRVTVPQHADSTKGIFTLFTEGIALGKVLTVPVP